MENPKPVVYILHGDDEFEIRQFIHKLVEKMGDSTTAGMNISRFDGATDSRDEIVRAVASMPFLSEYRLVICENPLNSVRGKNQIDNYRKFLDNLPPTTKFVMLFDKPLVDKRDRWKNKDHWLEVWAHGAGGRVFIREYSQPKGDQLVRWVRSKAKELGGEISVDGAALLADLVGEEPRVAAQELEKLMAYVNYSRPIEYDDVEYLTANNRNVDVFAMVDALANQNGKEASRMLHHLMEERDPISLFGLVVRQFRLLLMTRDLVDHGIRDKATISKKFRDDVGENVPQFVAEKLLHQVRAFTADDLDEIYHHLLSLDVGMKTGQIAGDIALETLVANLAG